MNPAIDGAFATLEGVVDSLGMRHNIQGSLHDLFHGLRQIRGNLSPQDWHDFSCEFRKHPVCKLLHQDPFTSRAAAQPRGYPGDARLMDYAYLHPSVLDSVKSASHLGRLIHGFTANTPMCQGARLRRDMMAQLIDDSTIRVKRPRILSVACGHLREVEQAHTILESRVRELVALDQDARSLEVVRTSYPTLPITCVKESIYDLLTRKVKLGTFNLVYSSGLLDYLVFATAQRLVDILFEMTDAGGTLCVANCVPGLLEAGYMETVMNWMLIYRSSEGMLDLAANLPQEQIAEKKTFMNGNSTFVYLLIRKI